MNDKNLNQYLKLGKKYPLNIDDTKHKIKR